MFSNNLLMAAAGGGGAAYEVENSIRLNDDDSANMSWTPSSAADSATVGTFSTWFKLGNLPSATPTMVLYETGASSNNRFSIQLGAGNTLIVYGADGGATIVFTTDMVFRDVTSWYNLVVNWDTASSPYMKMWINGVEPSYSVDNSANLSGESMATFENSVAQYLWSWENSSNYLDGYASQTVGIDGTAYNATKFGEFDDEGEWRNINVTGLTFGTNGFLQDYAVAPGTGNGAGTDVSGNDNHFTDSGLTAADQVSDSPTNNWCVYSAKGVGSATGSYTMSEGNLKVLVTSNGGWWNNVGTLAVSSGKWYWETTVDAQGAYNDVIGGAAPSSEANTAKVGSSAESFSIRDTSGNKENSGANSSYLGALVPTDVVCTALDLDNGKIWWRVNGDAWPSSGDPAAGSNEAYSFTAGDLYRPTASIGDILHGHTVNFGQTSPNAGGNADDNGYGDFDNAPPSGFLALCTANMTALDFDPADHHQVELVSHDGTSTAFTCSWDADVYDTLFIIKNRDSIEKWYWVDGLNGYDKYHSSDQSAQAQQTDANVLGVSGTTITLGSTLANDAYVVECHRGGAAGGVTNTDGDNTTDTDTTVSVNSVTEFAIIKYTGTASANTFGHGLSVAPDFWTIFRDDTGANHGTYHSAIGNTGALRLDTTGTTSTDTSWWNDTSPTASVFSLGAPNTTTNNSGDTYTMYAWAAVEGYSAFGSYEGNASTDGPVLNTGVSYNSMFIKNIDNAQWWQVMNSQVNTYNEYTQAVFYQSTSAETDETDSPYNAIDRLSNGVKCRGTGQQTNYAETYIYGKWGTPIVDKSETPVKAR